MPRVVIDDREVDVPPGGTLLDAARKLGFDVPALCFREGCKANTTCMVCVMRIVERGQGVEGPRGQGIGKSSGHLVPSCATIVEDGMRVESETDAIRRIRRTTLELLLSDHAGECRAPCQYACPFHTNIPRMVRLIAAGQVEDAIVILRRDVPLPAVLARVSPEMSEGGCRRSVVDEPVSIGLLKRYVADKSLVAKTPYVPPCKPGSGKRVAIVGAGPAGLSAAYFLLQQGHACTLFDAREKPGGRLREIAEQQLPREVLDTEIAQIEKLGARFELNIIISRQPTNVAANAPAGRSLDELRRDFDAVLITVAQVCDLCSHRLKTGAALAHEAGSNIFAAAAAVRPRGQATQAAADGKAAATCIDQSFRGVAVTGPAKLAALGTGRPRKEEIAALMVDADSAKRIVPQDPIAGLTDEEARIEAQRCLHCDCRKLDGCKLRKYAEMYGADARRYRGRRRRVERVSTHPDIVYEPGKCIQCGLCVQIAEQAREPLGLTFVGRGFDVRVAAPFDESLEKAFTTTARRCVEACPTGALAWKAEST